MYEINVNELHYYPEYGWLEIRFCREAAVSMMLDMLRLKLGKACCFTLADRGSGLCASVSFDGDTYSLSFAGQVYIIGTVMEELILSFLLDTTEAFPWYDHIDFTLENESTAIDVTIAVELPQ